MNTFLKRSLKEYRQLAELKARVADQNSLLINLIDNKKILERENLPFELRDREFVFLQLLAPLTEVAWADGSITNREMEAIMQTADAYGLVEKESTFCELMGNLLTRPSTKAIARVWNNLRLLMSNMKDEESEVLISGLIVQARFIAYQSSNNLMSLLRGERVCRDEELVIERLDAELKKARLESLGGKSAEAMPQEATASAKLVPSIKLGKRPPKPQRQHAAMSSSKSSAGGGNGRLTVAKEVDALLPLVPLVKVAWAEGRVTKRERQVIFDAASKMGIVPGTVQYNRLNDWLELHPSEDFYNQSFADLQKKWARLSPEEKDRRRFELLDRCTMVAEASGGTEKFAAGGARISDEEIAAVKHIAKKLNQRAGAELC